MKNKKDKFVAIDMYHYQIASGQGQFQLYKDVNRLLHEGYRPQGGVSVTQAQTTEGRKLMFHQAMTRGLKEDQGE